MHSLSHKYKAAIKICKARYMEGIHYGIQNTPKCPTWEPEAHTRFKNLVQQKWDRKSE